MKEEVDLTKKQFNKAIATVFLGLVIFITLLVALNLNLGFKVNGVVGEKNNVDIVNGTVQISFKTPIDFGQSSKDSSDVPNLKNYISVEPETDFAINVTGSILTLSFKETLDSDSTYKIILNKNLTDIYGNNLKKDKTIEFKTRVNEFSFIERNYPDSNDRILRTDINLKNVEVIYDSSEDKIIDQFSKNPNYYAVLLEKEDLTSNIKIIKNSEEVIDLDLINKKVKNINLFKNSNKLIYVAYDVEPQEQFLLPKGYSKFFIYDISNRTTSELDFGDRALEPSETIIANDDKSILFQNDLDSQYYLFDVEKPETIIGIGRQLQSGGFDFSGNKIVFVNFDPVDSDNSFPYLAIYSSDRKETVVPELEEYAVDPRFFSRTDNVIFSERRDEFEGTRGFFQIMSYSESDGKKLIVTSKDRSLELPKPSPDDRYVLIEEYSSKELLDFTKQRSFEFQTKPFRGSLMIYDLKENKVLQSGIKGISASWEI